MKPKTVKVSLLEKSPKVYEVVRFSNTVELSVGMEIAREKVEGWCGRAGVEVTILGKVEAYQGNKSHAKLL